MSGNKAWFLFAFIFLFISCGSFNVAKREKTTSENTEITEPVEETPKGGGVVIATDNHVYQAIVSLNRKFAGYNETDPRAVNTGIQFFLAPVGIDNKGIFRHASHLTANDIDSVESLYNLVDEQYRNGQYINVFVG